MRYADQAPRTESTASRGAKDRVVRTKDVTCHNGSAGKEPGRSSSRNESNDGHSQASCFPIINIPLDRYYIFFPGTSSPNRGYSRSLAPEFIRTASFHGDERTKGSTSLPSGTLNFRSTKHRLPTLAAPSQVWETITRYNERL